MAVFFVAILAALALTGGGGLSPGSLVPAVLAALTVLLISRTTVCHGKLLWYGGLFFILFMAATLIPFPGVLVGERRETAFAKAEDAILRIDNARLHEAARIARQDSDTADAGVAVPTAVEAESERHSGITVAPRVTLSVAGTVRSIFLAGGVFALFWLSAGAPGPAKRRIVFSLVAFGGLVAAVGILGYSLIPQGKTVLWSTPVAVGNPMGPFVNRNHFALLCALVAPAALVLTGNPGCNLPPQESGARGRRTFWSLVVSVTAGISFALLVAAVFLSLSRGGIIALIAGIGATAVFSVKGRPLVASFTVALAVFVFVALLFWPHRQARERIETLSEATETASAKTRFEMWNDALSVWQDFPVVGTGFGSFRAVYPAYKTSNTRKGALHCENEYLQILADGGIIGAGTLVFLLIVYITQLVQPFRRTAGSYRHGPWDTFECGGESGLFSAFGRLAVGALAALAANWLVDFGGRIPLNAFAAAILLGTAMPGLRLGGRRGEPSQAGMRRNYWNQRIQSLGLLAAFIVLALVFWPHAWQRDKDRELIDGSFDTAISAIAWAPMYWLPWYESGRQLMNHAVHEGTTENLKDNALAGLGVSFIRQAAEYNPQNYRLWSALAAAEANLGNSEHARRAAEKVIDLRPGRRGQVAKYLEAGEKNDR